MDLSICIITLNAREYLRACLDSIQKYSPALNYEIIIADNASTDGTVEMLAQNGKCIVVTGFDRIRGLFFPPTFFLQERSCEKPCS